MMIKELETSWNTHLNSNEHKFNFRLGIIKKKSKELLGIVEKYEKYISDFICNIKIIENNGDISLRLLRQANISNPTQKDYLKALISRKYLKSLHPSLSESSLQNIHNALIEWLQICCLEDKLKRMIQYCDSDKDMLITEILTERVWDVFDHPRWLLFEVESSLQIRPIQYLIADTLINNPASITQLNMGQGKTRVILPMLILHWIDDPDRTVRLTILSSLLDEAYLYLQSCLSSSSQSIRVLKFPFNRDIKITYDQSRFLLRSFKNTMKYHGVIMVAPEHRLSFYLKQIELYENDPETSKQLTDIENLRYMDIIDEVDDVLRYKYQLIYAMGNPLQLPSGIKRWQLLQSLLSMINNNSEIKKLLSDPNVATILPINEPGAFQYIRIIPGHFFNKIKNELSIILMNGLINNPPYSYEWLAKYSKSPKLIIDYVINIDSELDPSIIIPPDLKDDLMVLRGYLGHQILFLCLSDRYRVNFGLFEKSKKRLAIPFRAADLPSERTEFYHPDCALCFTHLAYYYHGMRWNDFLETFSFLLSSGLSQKRDIYNKWYYLSLDKMKDDPEATNMLDNVEKIYITNTQQMHKAYKYYKYNYEFINYWLENKILQHETMVYPQKIMATPWNLVNNSPVGFSGTNDTTLLLPLQIKVPQIHHPMASSLIATNGLMLDIILRNPNYEELKISGNKIYESVLDHVLKSGVNALIDAGALMAGISNEDAAQYLIENLDESKFKGVVFFDVKQGQWTVLTKTQSWPLHRSPIKEQDTIVYFDDSRCRGADMKLSPDATAILTIGPKMLKDKLIQAAGRMRKLQHSQKIKFLGLEELSTKIRETNNLNKRNIIKSVHVLRWVLDNTTENIIEGLSDWAHQGGVFCTISDKPELSFLEDNTCLHYLYGIPLTADNIYTFIQQKLKELCKRRKIPLSELNQRFYSQILNRCKKIGQNRTLYLNSQQECEREVEKEIENQKEIEKVLPQKTPHHEKDWDYNMIFNYDSIQDVRGQMLSISKIDKYLSLKNFKRISWDTTAIFCTENFLHTTQTTVISSHIDEYLRPVDVVIIFKNGLLLVSEREADKILSLMQKNNRKSYPYFTHLCYLSLERSLLSKPDLPDQTISNLSKVGMEIWNGQTSFSSVDIDCLKQLLTNRDAFLCAKEIVDVRGNSHLFLRSTLDYFGKKLINF